MNGTVSPATAARSGSSDSDNTNGVTQAKNNQQRMEPQLVILFAWLLRGSPAMSQQERAALSQLTVILRRYVFRILTYWGEPDAWHRSEDIVQIVLSRVLTWQITAQYVETRAARTTFLLAVVRHVLSEEYRKLKPGRTSPLAEDVEDSKPAPDEAMVIAEFQDRINEAIDSLPPHQAHAIRAQYGLAEPSEAFLGLSDSARNSLTCRARGALRVVLRKLAVHET